MSPFKLYSQSAVSNIQRMAKKKDLKHLLVIFTALVFFIQCSSNEMPTGKSGRLKFGILTKDASYGRLENEESPNTIVYTVQTASGEILSDELELIAFGSSYTTEEVTLPYGSYELIGFLVLNESGNAIYASPTQDSEMAYLVDFPLPISFVIQDDVIQEIVPEVILISEDDTPESFGYVSFSFIPIIVKALDLHVTFASDEMNAIPHRITVTASKEDSSDYFEHTFDFTAQSNRIYIPKGFDRYKIQASAGDDYLPHTLHLENEEIDSLNALSLELISKAYLTNGIIHEVALGEGNEQIGTAYVPSDLCLYYTRIDLFEGKNVEYVMNDRMLYENCEAGICPSSYWLPNLIECFTESEHGTALPCGNSINLWDNKPFNIAESYCEDAEYAKIDAFLMISTETDFLFYSFSSSPSENENTNSQRRASVSISKEDFFKIIEERKATLGR